MSDRLLPVDRRWVGSGSLADFAVAPSHGTWRPAAVDRSKATPRPSSRPRCDFCGGEIDNSHRHLFDRPKRSLVCVCPSCYGLFTDDGAGGPRFRAVPQRYALLPDAVRVTRLWDALRIPSGLSVLFTNSGTGLTTAYRPGADASESAVPLDVWREVERVTPALTTMLHDVEALVVRRTDRAIDAAIVPIDACYELIGRIRQASRDPHGDDEVSRQIDVFFARIAVMAQPAAV